MVKHVHFGGACVAAFALCAAGVSVCAPVMAGHAGPLVCGSNPEEAQGALRERFLDAMSARRASTEAGSAILRTYRIVCSSTEYSGMSARVARSHHEADPGLIADVLAWVEDRAGDARGLEAWRGTCLFTAEAAVITAERDLSQDTNMQVQADVMATGRAQNSGRMVHRRVTWIDDEKQISLQNDVLVETRPVLHRSHPMERQDKSLFDWRSRLSTMLGPGETRHFGEQGATFVLDYRREIEGGAWGFERSSYIPARGWAPAAWVNGASGVVQRHRVCGYVGAPSGGIERPEIVIESEAAGNGTVLTTVWIMDAWQDACDASALQPRLPPFFMNVDLRAATSQTGGSPGAESHGEIIAAPYLQEPTTPEGRLQAAMTRILEVWGSGVADADFNVDGVIDERDAWAAVRVLMPPQSLTTP